VVGGEVMLNADEVKARFLVPDGRRLVDPKDLKRVFYLAEDSIYDM